MPRRICPRHGSEYPCTCAMGNLYRFVEPVVLLLLKKKGRSYGYDLAGELPDYAFTDAEIEKAALYRTLRQLEQNGHVRSEWETDKSGPARRVYQLTPQGEEHLLEWAAVLHHVSRSMAGFVRKTREVLEGPRPPKSKSASKGGKEASGNRKKTLPPDGLRRRSARRMPSGNPMEPVPDRRLWL